MLRYRTKRYCNILFALLLVAGWHFGCKRVDTTPPAKIAAVIDSVRSVYCPDRRLAVFDANMTVRGANVTINGEVDNPAAIEALATATKAATKNYKVEIEIRLLPDATVAGEIYGLVTSSVASMRTKPEDSAELSNQLVLGSRLKLLKKKDDWYYVQTEDGYLGWVHSAFFAKGDEAFFTQWSTPRRLEFVDLTGQIYESPNASSLVVSDLVAGSVVREVERTRGWIRVALPDGRTGYVHEKGFVRYNPLPRMAIGSPDAVINTAITFLGLPYLWGGNSSKAFDCSGFTQTVFRLNGISLLRDASQQYRQGEEIDAGKNFSGLEPADLLFFGSSKDKINHVGIYLGDGRFIHSSGHYGGRVMINSLDQTAPDFNEYRYRNFRGARRIIQQDN